MAQTLRGDNSSAQTRERFKDELALRKLVKRKGAGKKIEAPPPAEDTGKVINLIEALAAACRVATWAAAERRRMEAQ